MRKKSSPPRASLSKKGFSLLATGLVVTIVNCSSSTGDSSNDSGTKIVGGQVEYGHPEVLRALVSSKSKAGAHLCTGVAIADNVLLLAAHCISEDTPDTGVLIEKNSQNISVRSTAIYTYDALRGQPWMFSQTVQYDIAAVVFPQGSFAPPYAKLAKSSSDVGESLTLIGYGASSYDDLSLNAPNGVKRSGTNTLAAKKEGALFLRRDLTANSQEGNAAAAPGDSGGPVYNSRGELVGLLSALYFSKDSKLLPIEQDQGGNAKFPVNKASHAGNAIVDLQAESAQLIIKAGLKNSSKGLVQSSVRLDDLIGNKNEKYLSIFFWIPLQMLSGITGAGSQALGNISNSANQAASSMQNAFNNVVSLPGQVAQSLFSIPQSIFGGLFGGGGSGGGSGGAAAAAPAETPSSAAAPAETPSSAAAPADPAAADAAKAEDKKGDCVPSADKKC